MSNPLGNPLRGKDPVYEPFAKPIVDALRTPRRNENDSTSTADSTGIAGKAHAVIYLSTTNFAVPTATPTLLNFDTKLEDNIGLWSISDPSKMVIPNWGYPTKNHWLFHAQVTFAFSTAGTSREVDLLINGAFYTFDVKPPPLAGQSQQILRVQAIIHEPNPGTFIQLKVTQDSGGNLNVINGGLGNPGLTFMEIISIW